MVVSLSQVKNAEKKKLDRLVVPEGRRKINDKIV